jgi:hypothetical protein
MKFFQRLRSQFHKQELDKDLSEELAFHIQQETEENIAAGMSAEDAHYAALRRFGGVDQVKEECRDTWGVRFIDTLLQDIRFGLRMLAKSPGFTAVVVLTLALAIGATTAIFSVVYAVLLRPLPFKDPRRLVMVWETWENRGESRVVVSPANFADWKAQSKTLDHLTAMWWARSVVTIQGEPTEIPAVRVTGDFFDALGVNPARGRPFSSEEQRHDGSRVAILSDSL